MKIFLSTIITLYAIAAMAQNDSTKNIVNTWKMNTESIAVAAKSRFEQLKKENPAMAGQITVDILKDMMENSTFQFTAEGKYIVSTPQGDQESTWKLTDDKTTVVIYIPRLGKEVKKQIKKINKSQLVLLSLDTNALESFSLK
jgi:hypothetical protein